MQPEVPRAGSMWLERAEARLRDGITGGRLALSASSFEPEPGGALPLFFSTVGLDELVLEAARLARDDGELVLSGRTAMYGFDGVDATLKLREGDGGLALEFRAGLDDSELRTLPGTSLAVERPGVRVEIAGAPASASGGIEGTLRGGGVELPFSLSGGSGGWIARGSFASVPLPGPAELLELAGAPQLAASVPGELLGGGRELSLTNLEVGFDPEAVRLSFLSLGVGVSGRWEILPGRLALDDLELLVSVLPGAGPSAIVGRIEATFEIAGSRFPLAVAVPAESGGVRLWLNTIDRIPLPGLADLANLVGIDAGAELPAGLDATGGVWVSELDLCFDAANRRLSPVSFEFGVDPAWDVVPGLLTVENVSVAMKVAHPDGASAPAVSGSVRGLVQVAGAGIALGGDFGEHLVLKGSITQLRLSRVAESLLGGAKLPDELPDMVFEDVELGVTPSAGDFSLRGSARIEWEVGESAMAARVDLTLERRGEDGHVDCTLGLRAAGPVKVAEAMIFEAVRLDFALDQGKSWSVSGGLSALIHGSRFELAAGYEQVDGKRTLRLSTVSGSSADLLRVEGLGSLRVDGLSVELTRPAEGAPEPTAWAVSGAGRLRIGDVFDFAGVLRVHRGADGAAGLVFSPTNATVEIPLPVPGHDVALELGFGGISILRGASAGEGAGSGSGWMFEASTRLACRGLPQAMADLLPEAIQATFSAGAGQVRLTADRILAPVELDLPDIEMGRARVPLGRVRLDACDLSVRLGKETELSAELCLGLPEELNGVFGVGEDGRPAVEFFRTYDPERPDQTVVKLRLEVGSRGLSLTPLTSPLQAIRLVEEGGRSFFYCDLGDCGEVKLQVPQLSLKGSALAANGGFEVVRPLQIPLTPIKLLLAGTAADAVLPDAVPLKGISLIDDSGSFRVEELAALLESVGPKLPPDVSEKLELIGRRLDRLPDSLKQYFRIELPKSFRFDLSITPSGGVRLDVGVNKGDPPIRLLVPGMVGPLPGLNGIELRNLAFGSVLGGALFLLEVDARLDQFNLATLLGSLLLPENVDLPLPDTRALERRIVLDRLFMIIVYQTGVPIPVPLFYEEVGVEYLGLEGLHLQAHASFPMPSFDLGEAASLFSGFKRFFTERDYLLDTENPPESLNLAFTLGANYLQLPEYLGGRLLGSRAGLGTIDAYSSLARLMNALKKPALEPLVRSVPLEHRVGTTRVSFGPLSLDAAWALTTPAEFREEAFRRLDLAPRERSATLEILPVRGAAPEGEDPSGLVVFLKGGTEIEGVAGFDALFGLVASDASGFATGARIRGSLAGGLELEIAGNVYIDPDRSAHDSAFGLDAGGRLTVGGREVLVGSASLDESGLTVAGALDLFPPGQPLELKGRAALRLGPRDFALEGQVAARLLGIAATGDLLVTERGLSLTTEGRIFKAFECALTVRGGNLSDSGGLAVSATMRNDLLEYLNREATRAIRAAAAGATAKLDLALAVVNDARAQLQQAERKVSELRRAIQAERNRKKRALANARAAVTTAQNNVNKIQGQIDATKRRIATLKNEINAKYRWYRAQPWHKGVWALSVYTAYATPRNAQIAANATKIAGLETAKWTALGALEVAKQALRTIEAGLDTFPIDLDPRMVALVGARQTATVALQGAEIVLEGVKAAVGAAADVATFIARSGPGALLDVRAARFDATLGVAAGGRVALMLELAFLGRPPRNVSLAIDFKNPLVAARSLAQQLLAR